PSPRLLRGETQPRVKARVVLEAEERLQGHLHAVSGGTERHVPGFRMPRGLASLQWGGPRPLWAAGQARGPTAVGNSDHRVIGAWKEDPSRTRPVEQ
ncbi:Hypothetical predicted protein, partial [Lynx pardinus]